MSRIHWRIPLGTPRHSGYPWLFARLKLATVAPSTEPVCPTRHPNSRCTGSGDSSPSASHPPAVRPAAPPPHPSAKSPLQAGAPAPQGGRPLATCWRRPQFVQEAAAVPAGGGVSPGIIVPLNRHRHTRCSTQPNRSARSRPKCVTRWRHRLSKALAGLRVLEGGPIAASLVAAEKTAESALCRGRPVNTVLAH